MKLRRLCLLLLLSLALSPGYAEEKIPTFVIGGKPVVIPPPAGFVQCTGVSEAYDEILRSMMVTSNRLVAEYCEPAMLEEIKAGKVPSLKRNFNAQIVRAAENRDIGEAMFDRARAEIRKGLEQAQSALDEKMKATLATGNKKISDKFNVDAALDISDMAILGFFEESATGMGFTMVSKVSSPGVEPVKMVTAAMMTPVNGRIISFYATSEFGSDEDRAWTESSVKAWRDAVQAANPRYIGTASTGISAYELGRITGFGLVVGVVVGLAIWLSKRGRQAE